MTQIFHNQYKIIYVPEDFHDNGIQQSLNNNVHHETNHANQRLMFLILFYWTEESRNAALCQTGCTQHYRFNTSRLQRQKSVAQMKQCLPQWSRDYNQVEIWQFLDYIKALGNPAKQLQLACRVIKYKLLFIIHQCK